MANIKISELDELLTINSNDILPIVDITNNETKKIKQKNLLPVDDAMKNNSKNPVQNKVIKQYVDEEAGKKVDKISIKNQKSTSTSDIYSCDYVNNATQKQIISVETGSAFNFTINEYTEINTWKLYNQNGNKFSVENGKVKVGTGISKVKITATLSIDNQGQDTIYCYPKLNGVSLSPWCLFNLNYAGTLTFSTMCTVKENDIISCALYSTKNANINAGRANMIIEAI